MNEDVKEIENTTENGDSRYIYKMGEGKDALTLVVRTGNSLHIDNVNHFWYSYLQIYVNDYENNSSFRIDSSYNLGKDNLSGDAAKENMAYDIAKRLCNDKSKNACSAKKFLKQIKGNPSIDRIKQHMDLIEKEQKRKLDNSKLAKLRIKLANKTDNLLGTNFEKTELPKSLKKVEKAISDRLFGKVKE